MAWISGQPIGNQIADAYGIKLTLVNFVSLLFQIFFLAFSIPTSYLIETKGVHLLILSASLMQTLGMAMKIFINNSFDFFIVGQCFPALASVIIINSVTKVASVWFG